MSRQRFTALLIAALIVLVGAYHFAGRRNLSQESVSGVLLPALSSQLDAVTEVTVVKAGPVAAVTIHKMGAQWAVAQRRDYPADVTKLRKLLTSLSDAKIVEQKTADPARYAAIAVDDPAQPTSSAVGITVVTPAGSQQVIVGKSIGEGNFVRLADQKQSYAVEPAISVETDPRYWIDSKLLNVASSRIQTLSLKPADGPGYTLHRPSPPAGALPGAAPTPGGAPSDAATKTPATAKPSASGQPTAADPGFTLDGVPAGRHAVESAALAPSPTLLTDLSAEDVSPADQVDFSHSSQLTLTLTDGSVLMLTGVVAGDKHWLQVREDQDQTLSSRIQGRAFEIPSYRYDAIFRPLEQLLVPKPVPPAKKNAGAPPPGGLRAPPTGPRAPGVAGPHPAHSPAP